MIRAIVPSPPLRKIHNQRRRLRSSFSKIDLTRAVDAARKIGFDVHSIEIGRDGCIRLVSGESSSMSPTLFDEWEGRL
jgi:hypothetical protein